jgi:hypothetical protein
MVKLKSSGKFIKYIGVPDFSGLYPYRSTVMLEQPPVSRNGLSVGTYRIFRSTLQDSKWSALEFTGLIHRPGQTIPVDIPALGRTPSWSEDNIVCDIPAHFIHCLPEGCGPDDSIDDALRVQNAHHGRDIYVQFSAIGNGSDPLGFGGAKYRCMLHGAPGVDPIRLIQSPKVYLGPGVDTYLVLMHFSCFGAEPAPGRASIFLCSPEGRVIGSCDIKLSGTRCYAISMKRLLGSAPPRPEYVGTVIAVVYADVVPLIYSMSDDGSLCSTDHSVPPMKYLASLYRGDVKRETAQNLITVLRDRSSLR